MRPGLLLLSIALVPLAACASTMQARKPASASESTRSSHQRLGVRVLSPAVPRDFESAEILFAFQPTGGCAITEIKYSAGEWSSVLKSAPWEERVNRRTTGIAWDTKIKVEIHDACGDNVTLWTSHTTID